MRSAAQHFPRVDERDLGVSKNSALAMIWTRIDRIYYGLRSQFPNQNLRPYSNHHNSDNPKTLLDKAKGFFFQPKDTNSLSRHKPRVHSLAGKRSARRFFRGEEVRRQRNVLSRPASFVQRTKDVFQRRPLISNCLALGGMYAGAELSQQAVNHIFKQKTSAVRRKRPLQIDYSSMQRLAVVGSCVYGPLFRAWYFWLDRAFPGTATSIIVQKVCLDQFVLGPPSLALFFVTTSWLEGKTHDVTAECRRKFWPTYFLDCLFWVPVQAVNFWLVPPTFRVLFLGVAGFVWLNVLCIIKNIENYVGCGEEDDILTDTTVRVP